MADPADASRSAHLSLPPSTDTPLKPSIHNRVMYGESAEQAQESVMRDLKKNVRIVSPTDFRKQFLDFSASGSLSGPLQKVQNDFYSDGRWTKFPEQNPDKDPLEFKFYRPFVEIAEAVNKACRQHAPGDAIESIWLDRNAKAPGALSKDDPKVRPDIVQVSKSASKEFEELMSVEEKDKMEKSISIWWMQIHTIVEIKPTRPKSPKKFHDTIVQLGCYIRQLFREQFDRHFVISLLLCGEELTLWFCDRVGLVGTIEPINIHEDPKEFLNILAAFSMLPAHRLGWDPTMTLYPAYGTKAVPSYTVFEDRHPYTIKWCISMPSKEDPNRREEFVMVRALITVFSQRICGRASLVWEAITKEDFQRGEIGKVFVLKQAWQPVTEDEETTAFDAVFEVDMYEKAQLRKDRVYSYERVKTEDNTIVSTRLFRGDLKPEEFEQATKRLKNNRISDRPLDEKTGQKRIRSEADEPFSYIELLDVKDNIFRVDVDKTALHPRALVRILMDKRGYPLKYFVDNLELVTALRDAVRDHENMYEKGILHRDISFGNILICDDDTNDMKDAGMLIDLDHAKYSSNRRPLPFYQGQTMDQGREVLLLWYREQHASELEPDIVSRAMQIFENPVEALTYLDGILETLPERFRNDRDTTILTANKLYWPHEIKQEIPDFDSHEPREGLELTGTIPFISIKLMRSAAPLIHGTPRPIHDAVHDMESILWVLLYVCLTREANEDGIRRRELRPNSAEKNDRLLTLLCEIFDRGNTESRINCLDVPAAFEEVLKDVHSYFDCLKPLLLKLRWVLYLAHKYKGIERYNIHSIVLAIFEETIAELKQHRNDQEILKAKENRRKKWMKWRAVPQVPDANEGSERPSNIGGYSPISEAKNNAAPPPDSHQGGKRRKHV